MGAWYAQQTKPLPGEGLPPEQRFPLLLKRAQLVCGAVTLVLPMLLLVGTFMRGMDFAVTDVYDPAFRTVFIPFVLVGSLGTVWLLWWMFDQVKRSTEDMDVREDRALDGLFGTSIPVMALGEMPILLGFVDYFQGDSFFVWLGFIALGVGVWVTNFPTRARWERRIERALGYAPPWLSGGGIIH